MRMNLILFIPLLHTLPSYIPADVFTALTDTTCANILYDTISAANRLIGEVVQSRRRPLLGPSPG